VYQVYVSLSFESSAPVRAALRAAWRQRVSTTIGTVRFQGVTPPSFFLHITCMNTTRRDLVKNLSMAAGLSAALPWRRARGSQPARLDVKDPAAVAVGYVENAAQVDIKKYPAYVKGSNCENCLQLQGSAAITTVPADFPRQAGFGQRLVHRLDPEI